eukprot:gene32524-39324_t
MKVFLDSWWKKWRRVILVLLILLLFSSTTSPTSPGQPTGQPTAQPSAQPFRSAMSDYMAIDTYAGYTANGFDNRGNQGDILYARFDTPRGIYVDTAGIVYIIEKNYVRQVVSGINTIIVGLGTATEDDVDASISPIVSGYGIVGDSTGNLYFSDSDPTCIVRRVTAITLKVSTYAGARNDCGFLGDGGLAASSKLNKPRGLAILSNVLYIADFTNNRIRSVDLTTTIIRTFAGTGNPVTSLQTNIAATSADFNGPSSIASNAPTGGLFAEDAVACVVRRILVATGIVNTAAGNGVCAAPPASGSFVGPSNSIDAPDVVCSSALGLFYIFKNNAYGLYQQITMSSRIAGGTSAVLYADNIPLTSIRIDRAGGCFLDSSSNLYYSDYVSNRIWRVSIGTSSVHVYAGYVAGVSFPKQLAPFGRITSMWENTLGDMYLTESTQHRVSMISRSTGMATVVAGTGYSAFVADGVLATLAPMASPRTVITDSVGNLYIAEYSGTRIRRVDKDSVLVSTVVGGASCTTTAANFVGASTSVCITTPTGLAIDSSGAIYFSNDADRLIRKLTLPGNIVSTFAGTGSYSAPAVVNVPALSATFEQPKSMWIDIMQNNTLYFGDYGIKYIRKIYYDRVTNSWRMIPYGGTGVGTYNGDLIPATT